MKAFEGPGRPGQMATDCAVLLTSPKGRDRGDTMMSSTTTRREGHLEQPISRDVSVARGLLDRDDLLDMLDRGVTKRVTVINR